MEKQELKSKLMAGETLQFSNAIFQERMGSDDIRAAELSFTENDRCDMPWKIWFNGALIHGGKRFDHFFNRFAKLQAKWNLEFDAELTPAQ